MAHPIKTESMFKAYEEANLKDIKEKLALAQQQKIIYMSLNDSAFKELQPLIEYLVKKKKFNEALEYLHKNSTDCVEKVLVCHNILMRQKEHKK